MAWLTGWNRRKQLYLNGTTGSQSSYQMKITVYYGSGADSAGILRCGSNCKTDFSDIRFTSSDGSTVLNYWIESSISSNNAVIWVQIPSIPTGSNSTFIYIYYNNPSATSLSNGTNTFLFFDDCSGTTYTNKWTQTDAITCAGASTYESSGLLTQNVPGTGGSGDAGTTISATGLSLGNNIEYYIKIPTLYFWEGGWSSYRLFLNASGTWADSHWWCSSNRNGPSNGIEIEFGYNGSNYTTNFWLYDITNSVKTSLGTKSGMSLTNYILKVTYNRPDIKIYTSTDGVTWTLQLSGTSNTTYPLGTITSMFGGCCDRGSRVQYSFFRVRNYASTEPAWSSTISAEQNVTLTVNSTPVTGAEIWLRHPQGSGSYIDQGTQTNATLYIPADSYDIKLTRGGYQDYYLLNQTYSELQSYSVNATLTPLPGSLSISSTPSGAEIFLALQPGTPVDQGVTTQPAGTTISNLTPGTYNVRLTLANYQDWTGTATVTSQCTTCSLSATFAGSLNLSSTPSGASIYIDDVLQPAITTPAIITGLSNGSHSLKLTLLHYYDLTDTFNITAGSTTNVSETLNPSTGTLNISSSPSSASIYIDNILQTGITTPANILYLTPGTHSYLLILTGYADYSGTFSITAGQTTNLNPTFLGSLNVSSTPTGASIYLDNVLQTGTTPQIITGLSSGSHQYKLTLTNYADYSGTFSITAGQTTNLNITFLGSLNISSTPTGASIYIDNILQTGTTPQIITGLSSGSHTYRAIRAGYSDIPGTYNITAGQINNLSLTFVPLVSGITNGTFNTNINGWTSTGPGATWDNGRARVDIDRNRLGCVASTIEQMFIIDSDSLSFVWWIGDVSSPSSDTPEYVEYDFYVDGVLRSSDTMGVLRGGSQSRTTTIDTSSYVGREGRLVFYPIYHAYCLPSGFLTVSIWIDNVTTRGILNILSTPLGANIYLDDSPISSGTTPLTISDLIGGTHTYKLTLTGYPDVTGSFSITAGSTTNISEIFTGNVNISSTPTEADIYLDDNPISIGTTPISLTGLSPGTHSFRLTFTGYADATGNFSISSGTTTDMSVAFLGNLDIGSIPIGASIYLDDNPTPIDTTPSIIMGLSSGPHDITLTLINYYDWIDTVTVSDASTTIVNATLIPKYGSINIKSTPNGSAIYLDGSLVPIGITNSPEWVIIPDITVGSHTFRLSHIDYGDVTGDFDVYPNEITQITAVLDPTPGVPTSYAVWDPTTRARLRVYKCKKIDIEQLFLIDKSTLSFDFEITADADPEIIRWQLIVGGNIVIDDVIPATSYGTSTGHVTKDVTDYVGSNGTIKLYVESGPDCLLSTHENTYLYIDNVMLT